MQTWYSIFVFDIFFIIVYFSRSSIGVGLVYGFIRYRVAEKGKVKPGFGHVISQVWRSEGYEMRHIPTQCWFRVDPASDTLSKHWNIIVPSFTWWLQILSGFSPHLGGVLNWSRSIGVIINSGLIRSPGREMFREIPVLWYHQTLSIYTFIMLEQYK